MSGTAAKFLTLSSGVPELVETIETSSGASAGLVVGLNSASVVDVTIGGTGNATNTAHAVLIGEGTSQIAFAGPDATSGIPLISQGSSTDPAFGTATVPGGGTGLTSITAHDLLVGNGTSAPNLVAPSATSGVPLVSQGSSSDPHYGTAVVAGGGTGAATLTAHAVLLGEGTSTLGFATIGNAGYVLTDNGSGMDPTFQAPSSSGNPTATILAAADIAAGSLVNVYNNSGTANVVEADNTSSSTFANGVALSAISNGDSGVITFGALSVTLSGLTPGQLFLGISGGVTSTAPSSSGDVVQPVGLAVSSTVAILNPGQNYNIA